MPDFLLRKCAVCGDLGTWDQEDPNGTMVLVFVKDAHRYECLTCFKDAA